MKKVMLVVSAVVMVAFFASCDKTCKCKQYVAGVLVKEYTQEIDKGMKCSDYTGNIATEDGKLKTGLECK